MEITRYISELLYEHECVVLPGLGGFITSDKPATVNRITHRFTPPSRKIIFNTQLSENDGLLINHIALAEGSSYKEAKQHVEEFVENCRLTMETGKRLTFEKIGVLYKNPEGHVVFEQDKEINYNPDSFGLTGFYSPAVDRGTDEERLKGIVEPLLSGKLKPRDRKERIRRKRTGKKYRAGVVALVMFLVLLIIGGSLTLEENARSYWQNYTALIPVFDTDTPSVHIRPNINETAGTSENTETGIAKDVPGTDSEIVETVVEEETNSGAENVPVASAKTEQPKEITTSDRQLPAVKPSAGSYMIIAGSFSEEKNAAKLVSKLNENGIRAMIADTSRNGMYRVAYASFATLEEAKEKLYAIRNEQFPDAWILRKK